MHLRHVAFFAVLTTGTLAAAQDCEFPACPTGHQFTGAGSDASGPYAMCSHCVGFPTFACSHGPVRCPAGSTLNPATGECRWNLCDGCGGELPLCPSDRTYSGFGTSASGVYGSCKSCNGFPTFACSHSLEYCDEGWTLQTSTGMCRKSCLPDLVIRSTWLRDAWGSVVSSVRYGRPYYVCAEVRNVGLASSGSCALTGGGLGVPATPTTSVPALAALGSVTRCLYYSTTPSVGTWSVGLTVDPARVVPESADGNNTVYVSVPVVP